MFAQSAAVVSLFAATCAFGAGSFTLIGDATGPRTGTLLLDISEDGQIAVGISRAGSTWRWTPATLLEGIGASGGYACISADGTSIVSELLDFNFPNPPAYPGTTAPARYVNGSWESIGGDSPCDATLGWPRDINTDGSRFVGGMWFVNCTTWGYMWTPQGRIQLRSHVGLGGSSVANRISADNSTIVGFNNGPGVGGRVGVYWTYDAASARWLANFMNGNFNHGELYDVSADGNILLGRGHSPTNRPYMFNRTTNVFEFLGPESAAGTSPFEMTADRSVVIGGGSVWRRSTNTWVSLGAYMNDFGVPDMLTIQQSNIVVATSMTADGRFIAGWYGPSPLINQGWIFDRDGATTCVADVDDGTNTGTPDGGVTIADLVYFLSQFESGGLGADVDNGTQTGVRDLAVTVDDLVYFLIRFEAGC